MYQRTIQVEHSRLTSSLIKMEMKYQMALTKIAMIRAGISMSGMMCGCKDLTYRKV